MSDALVNRVKKLLNAEHYYMNHDWLQECVNYNMNVNPDAQALKDVVDFVKTQWLLSDLTVINTNHSTLPENIAEKKHVVLPGSYMLQVNEMYDISQPKYKQLQTIHKVNTFNVEVTEDDNSKENGWEAKTSSKQMMYLKMTDGVQNIVGMEYSPILMLNDVLLPGYKVLIKGPVKSRNGVLFLKEGNIEGKGGEVESLLIRNARENILARALNKPENEDPYGDDKPKDEVPENDHKDPDLDALLDDGDFDIDEICNIESTHMQNNDVSNTRTSQGIRNTRDTLSNSTSNNTSCRSTETNNRNQQAELNLLQREQDQRNRPFITEPGGEDDDIFVVCDDIMLSEMPINQGTSTFIKNIYSNNRSEVPPSSKQSSNSASTAHSQSKPIRNQPTRLCDVLSENLTGTKTVAVTAKIKELEKLRRENSMWAFNCSISDGSASMDVSFTNEVLEKIIGLSAKEFVQRKKRKKDPHVFQELQTILRRAEYSLRVIDITEIKLTQGEKPVVVQVSELNEKQQEELVNH